MASITINSKANIISNLTLTAAILFIGVAAPIFNDIQELGYWIGLIATFALITLFKTISTSFVKPTFLGLAVIVLVIAVIPSSIIEMHLNNYLKGVSLAFGSYFIIDILIKIIELPGGIDEQQ